MIIIQKKITVFIILILLSELKALLIHLLLCTVIMADLSSAEVRKHWCVTKHLYFGVVLVIRSQVSLCLTRYVFTIETQQGGPLVLGIKWYHSIIRLWFSSCISLNSNNKKLNGADMCRLAADLPAAANVLNGIYNTLTSLENTYSSSFLWYYNNCLGRSTIVIF